MKKIFGTLLLIAGIAVTNVSYAASSVPQEQAPSGVTMFYSDLTPYGEWIEFQPDLYAWRPLQIDPGWRPYTAGRWVWSDYGWYWVSSEPYGWVTYHYGRWYLDDSYGWVWIPDTVWGPAWVEWRYNDDYIGWAPLPPYARFHMTVGIRFTTRWNAPVRYWSFLAYNDFASVNIYRNYAPASYTQRLISTTRSAGRYAIDQDRIVNHGVNRSFIQQRIPNRIETAQVEETRQRGVERVTRSGQTERVEIFRARPDEPGQSGSRIEAQRAQTKPSLDVERIDRYRTVPQRGERSGQIENSQPGRGFQIPDRQIQRQGKSEQRSERPEVKKERPLRLQPAFPTPRIERTTPNRPQDGKNKGRSRGNF